MCDGLSSCPTFIPNKALGAIPIPASPQPHSNSSSLEPLISQLCPSKPSWLRAQCILSSHSGAKYLYYYCNYFPISMAQG